MKEEELPDFNTGVRDEGYRPTGDVKSYKFPKTWTYFDDEIPKWFEFWERIQQDKAQHSDDPAGFWQIEP
ncbi:hypothetical protein MMC18_002566 [Xylographa bjoerkii]|nr:hypothetical protein [Xylographa bjoerkii]